MTLPAVFEVDIGVSGEQQLADFNMAPASRHVERGAATEGGETRHTRWLMKNRRMSAERLSGALPFVGCVHVGLVTEEQAACFGFVVVSRVMQRSPSTGENQT